MGSISNKNIINCDIIAQSLEKFIAFNLDSVQILDSIQFLPASLNELVENHRKSNYDFPPTKKIFEDKILNNRSDEEYLMKKSYFPYEYMDGFERYKETSLPKRKFFFSNLLMATITKEEFKFTRNVWNIFEFKTL